MAAVAPPARKRCSAATEQHYIPGLARNDTARQSFFALGGMPMTAQAVEGACAFAWRNCLLLHSGVSENDDRRAALYRYVTRRGDTDEYDFDLL